MAPPTATITTAPTAPTMVRWILSDRMPTKVTANIRIATIWSGVIAYVLGSLRMGGRSSANGRAAGRGEHT